MESTFGKYKLVRRLGTGGMAEVFLAKAFGPEGVEKPLVIKRLHPHLSRDLEFVNMFIDEARISMLLRHGNIVPVFDFGKVEDIYYLAMEYVEGVSLSRLLEDGRKQGSRLPLELSLFVAVGVCQGLDHAHRLKDQSGRALHVVHRDLSPQNVMISFDGEVKLVDFGIARAASQISQTEAGLLKGKVRYMSPEQLEGHALDARSDLFAVGLVLYEMLGGMPLSPEDNPVVMARRWRTADVPPPSRYHATVPPSLDRIVLRCLALEPQDRYPSAAELGEDLSAELYRLSPAFLPRSLASFTRRMCGHQEPEPGIAEFEERLLREVGLPADPRSSTEGSSSKAGSPPSTNLLEKRPAGPSSEAGRRGARMRRRLPVLLLLLVLVGLGAWLTRSYLRRPARVTDPGTAQKDATEAHRQTPTPLEARPSEHSKETEAPAPATGRSGEGRRIPVRLKAAPRRAAPGTVQINAEPWANVYLDGKDLGHTPLVGLELPAGRHRLKLVNPELGVEKELPVEVVAGKTTKVVVHLLE